MNPITDHFDRYDDDPAPAPRLIDLWRAFWASPDLPWLALGIALLMLTCFALGFDRGATIYGGVRW